MASVASKKLRHHLIKTMLFRPSSNLSRLALNAYWRGYGSIHLIDLPGGASLATLGHLRSRRGACVATTKDHTQAAFATPTREAARGLRIGCRPSSWRQ